jgi:hypothetical protein
VLSARQQLCSNSSHLFSFSSFLLLLLPLTPPLFNNLHEYFQPVFDELDKLNKMLDSHIDKENDKSKEKKK